MEEFIEIDNKINSLKTEIETFLSSFYEKHKQHLDTDGSVNKHFIDKIGGIEVYEKWIETNQLKNTLKEYIGGE